MTTTQRMIGAADEFTKMEEVDEADPGLPPFALAKLAAFRSEMRHFSDSVHSHVSSLFLQLLMANSPGLC